MNNTGGNIIYSKQKEQNEDGVNDNKQKIKNVDKVNEKEKENVNENVNLAYEFIKKVFTF